MNEFKPGDVVVHPEFGRGIVTTGASGSDRYWAEFASGETILLRDVAPDLRRLVVIDPRDREEVERLLAAHYRTWGGLDQLAQVALVDTMQAALHEFANPKPPKPDEPIGLGAVVEDANGLRWVRVGLLGRKNADDWKYAGSGLGNVWKTYADIDAVKVLSPGVEVEP